MKRGRRRATFRLALTAMISLLMLRRIGYPDYRVGYAQGTTQGAWRGETSLWFHQTMQVVCIAPWIKFDDVQ